MNYQRLRNLTTGRLHTEMGHVYEDLSWIVGDSLMTHMLPNAAKAVEPWLKALVTDPTFWNEAYDPKHQGEYHLPTPTEDERRAMLERYMALPHPFANLGNGRT